MNLITFHREEARNDGKRAISPPDVRIEIFDVDVWNDLV